MIPENDIFSTKLGLAQIEVGFINRCVLFKSSKDWECYQTHGGLADFFRQRESGDYSDNDVNTPAILAMTSVSVHSIAMVVAGFALCLSMKTGATRMMHIASALLHALAAVLYAATGLYIVVQYGEDKEEWMNWGASYFSLWAVFAVMVFISCTAPMAYFFSPKEPRDENHNVFLCCCCL